MLSKVIEAINSADGIAIFAGAGMSADSGLTPFRGANGIWTKSISVGGKDFNYLDLMTHQAFIDTPLEAWKFIISLEEKYSLASPHEGYYKLLSILNDKEYFVTTSNIDNQFLRAGFDQNRIYECHGSIQYMQCLDILERDVWKTPEMKAASIQFDDLPTCPNCGGMCRPNVLLFADWFWIPIRSTHQQIRYINWCNEMKKSNKRIIAIEIGAGKTIQTIRNAAEKFVSNDYTLIRVNPFDFDIHKSNHISIKMNALEFLMAI